MDRARLIEQGLTKEEFCSIEMPSHPDAAIALQFWNERRSDGIRLGRDIPSRAISRLLSRLTVFRPIDDGSDADVYLVGADVRHRFGRDITGERLSQMYNAEQFSQRISCQKEVLKTGRPNASKIIHRIGGADLLKLELLRMPAVAPNGIDHWVLAFVFYF